MTSPAPDTGADTPAPEAAIPAIGVANRQRSALTRRRRITTALTCLALACAGSAGLYWLLKRAGAPAQAQAKKDDLKPAVAAGARLRLFDTAAAAPASAPSSAPRAYTVPDVIPGRDDEVRPIGLAATAPPPKPRPRDPRDAPIMLRSGSGSSGMAVAAVPGGTAQTDSLETTSRQLQDYRQQLGQMIQQAQARQAGTAGMIPTALPLGAAPGTPALPPGVPAPPLPQGQPPVRGIPVPDAPQPPQGGGTREVWAGQLANPALTLTRGSFFLCNLRVRVISTTAGDVSCIVPRDVYSEQRVLLLEAGTRVEGDYRLVQIKPGETRIPVIWSRLKTPTGITVDLEAPGTGALGEAGIGGTVENRWGERIGASLLLSLIDDAVKIVIADKQSDATGGGTNVVLGGTAQTGSRLAEKVLDATINIPPRITATQGGTVGVYVRQDIRFDNVYALRPAQGDR
ncbi:TrbI/VirB10 family protein [Azohydromonas australica]|uniref:TrbI/VirB10 family protein n=1 Tax=Azohydromonas australica TaxID=364039 RepID=UPI000414AEEE|nr:TrbI/VirB10 family protein [Azohydromonas australica]